MMMNNPAILLAQAMRSGKNPGQLLQRMAAQDSRISQAVGMIRGKSPQELEQMARNMARERGVNVEDLARELGAFGIF